MDYIKGKGVLVGTFNENDVRSGKDKEETAKMQNKTGYKYTNTEMVMKNGKFVAIRVYVCSVEDFRL